MLRRKYRSRLRAWMLGLVVAMSYTAAQADAPLSRDYPGFLSAPAGALRWAVDSLTYNLTGNCSGATVDFLNTSHGPYYYSPIPLVGLGIVGSSVSPGAISPLGVASYAQSVPCTNGRYRLQLELKPDWKSVTPGTYDFVAFVDPAYAPFTTILQTAPLKLTVRMPVPPVAPIAGLWWAGPSESGWGINVVALGDKIFIAAFVYDSGGTPTWIVMSDGSWDASHTTWSGQFYRMHGSPFTSYSAAALTAGWAGAGSFNFSNPEAATFTFSTSGASVTKSVSRFVFSPDASAGPYAGLWWGGATQDGWGLSVAQQGEAVFATWYSYGSDGEPLWFYMPGATKVADGHYAGALYSTRGAAWIGASSFDGSQTRSTAVGTLDLVFRDAQAGTMTATVNGAKVTNEIQRFGF